MKALKPITDLFKGGSAPKKSFRWRVIVRGKTVSRHTSKSLAAKAARSVRGGRAAPIKKRY